MPDDETPEIRAMLTTQSQLIEVPAPELTTAFPSMRSVSRTQCYCYPNDAAAVHSDGARWDAERAEATPDRISAQHAAFVRELVRNLVPASGTHRSRPRQ